MIRKISILFIISLLGSGCSSYYVVTSDYVKDDMSESIAEVVETATYRKEINNITTLAVKAPDACINQTASQASGEASTEGTILKTACGVEMALLERELARFGFQVISWKVLNNRIEAKSITPIAAAKELQAHALLQINSFEKTSVLAGQNARWDRRYYRSDSKATLKKNVSLPERDANALDFFAKIKEETLLKPERLSATIDSSVTLTKSGQAIWFYEWTHSESEKDELSTKTHLISQDKQWNEVRQQAEQRRETTRSGSSTAVSVAKQAKDRRNARHNILIKYVVKDLVSRLAKGKS